MVKLSQILRLPIKFKGGGTLFDDHLTIYVRGGRGGKGLPMVGGCGGDGGDVYLVAKPKITLTSLQRKFTARRFIASDGKAAGKVLVLGEKGKDLMVQVPVGITVETQSKRLLGIQILAKLGSLGGREKCKISFDLGDLNKINETLLVSKGGEGGSPKSKFVGGKGMPHVLHLHVKLIADIGFVGFPNAGKSTLLKALSNASPLISAFPFTTVRPQIGVMEYPDFRKISLADLPGLIEGAHLNMGMGHQFLKHVERTMMLMFVVDLNGFQLSLDDKFRNAYETIILLNKELELYDPSLLDKPAILCVNKMDTDNNNSKFNKLVEKLNRRKTDENIPKEVRPEKFIEFEEILPVSAKDKNSTKILKEKLRTFLDTVDTMKKQRSEFYEKEIQSNFDEIETKTSII